MKKLITTYTGGFPLTLDRVRWMEDGINEAILAICSSMLPPGASSMILEGCEISETSQDVFSVSRGWIYLGGGCNKICKVNPHTFTYRNGEPFPNTGETPRWVFYTYNDLSGSVTFFDGSNKQVHRIEEASVQISGDDLKPAVASVPGRDGMWVQGDHIKSRIADGCLQLSGEVDSITNIGLLPMQHRLMYEISIPIVGEVQEGNVKFIAFLTIYQSGNMVITPPSQQGTTYYVNCIIPI